MKKMLMAAGIAFYAGSLDRCFGSSVCKLDGNPFLAEVHYAV
jgi:hypothetical protein